MSDRFQEIFLKSLKGPLVEWLGLREEAVTSYSMGQSPVQDPFKYRARYLGLRVAEQVLDEQGELNRGRLEELVRLLDQTPFILGPGREGDALIYGHLRGCLRRLVEEKEVWAMIRKFSPPLCHKRAEEIVRETLWPEPVRVVQTSHIRKAALVSWLTLLRQTTGSCFATAPAILIQEHCPLRFFKDLYDLLSIGQLKRTVAGKEYSVPLSLSSEKGDLQRPTFFLERSPGISAALESSGVLWTSEVQEKIREQGFQTAEGLLRSFLLEAVGLTEEDLEDEERLARIRLTPLLARQTAVYYQKPSERAQKVTDWKKRIAIAHTTFQTFTECSLLRSWEYTIASFCDVKTEFARWNLYIGLGLHPDHKGGIGAFLYEQVNGRLQQCNQEIERLSREYEQEAGAIQALETMLRDAGNQSRYNQLKAAWTSRTLSAHSIEDLRNHMVAKAEGLAEFFPFLIEQYDRKLQEAFQELFDPALSIEKGDFFDDSFAGFRLVYKHGRSDASQWTPIYTGEEYIHCLREFFSDAERDLSAFSKVGGGLVSEITTALIQFVQESEFLASALRRSQEMGRRSPWDYISGGTLQSLLMAYCNRDRPFTELKIIPHSEGELLRFLMQVDRPGSLLIHSPTHAFVFYPELLLKSNHSGRQAIQEWNGEMQEYLAYRLSEKLPDEERALFIHLYRQKGPAETNVQFRSQLIEVLGPRIKNKAALVDSLLYEQTPLFSPLQAKAAAEEVLRVLGRSERIGDLEGAFFGSLDVYQMVKAAIFEAMGQPFSSIDWDGKIAETMRQLGFRQPSLFLFGDTNWSTWLFGFVAHPVLGRLELWRLNRNGMQGFPMSDWQEWLGPEASSPWVVLSENGEYTETT